MHFNNDKYAWIVKIGEKGQFVIPKEARDIFDLQPGEEYWYWETKKKELPYSPKNFSRNI